MMPRPLARMMSLMMCSCEEVTRFVSASLDRGLPWYHRVRLRMHFLMCVLCRRYRDQVRFIRHALRSHAERLENQETPLPAGLSPESRERIKRALGGEEESAED